MNVKIVSLLTITLVLMAACSSMRVWTDSTESADMATYNTYQIDDQCSDYNPGVNPINQIRVQNAIELKLRELGYERAEVADMKVVFVIKNETKYFYDNCLPNYNHFSGGIECLRRIHAYEEGTLIVDLIDTKSNAAFWHGGAGSQAWQLNRDPDKKIKEMVEAIFELLPANKVNQEYAKN